MTNKKIIKGLSEVMKHIVDACDREEITESEANELIGYILVATNKLAEL